MIWRLVHGRRLVVTRRKVRRMLRRMFRKMVMLMVLIGNVSSR